MSVTCLAHNNKPNWVRPKSIAISSASLDALVRFIFKFVTLAMVFSIIPELYNIFSRNKQRIGKL